MLPPDRFCPFPSFLPAPPSLPCSHSGTPAECSPLSQALWEPQEQLPPPCHGRIFPTPLPRPPQGDRHPDAQAGHSGTPSSFRTPRPTPGWARRWLRRQRERHGSATGAWNAGASPAVCPGFATGSAALENSSPWARSVLASRPSRGAQPWWARPGTGPRRRRAFPAAHTGRCCTAGGDHGCPSAPLDLTAGLAELAGKRAEEPRRRVPRSSPTRIISSYFQGKACHSLCVFNPSLQSQGTPALLGAHCSPSPKPPTPQHSLQKGREEKGGF